MQLRPARFIGIPFGENSVEVDDGLGGFIGHFAYLRKIAKARRVARLVAMGVGKSGGATGAAPPERTAIPPRSHRRRTDHRRPSPRRYPRRGTRAAPRYRPRRFRPARPPPARTPLRSPGCQARPEERRV